MTRYESGKWHALGLAAATLLSACGGPEVLTPGKRDSPALRMTSAEQLLGPAAYAGNLQAGKFIVCASKYSTPGFYTHSIVVTSALPSDRYVQSVTLQPGECAVVFATRRRGGLEPEIRVTRAPAEFSHGAVLIDRNAGQDLYFDDSDAPLDLTLTLSGFEGAVAKFYYGFATFRKDCIPGVTCTVGGHGGTGTVNFQVD